MPASLAVDPPEDLRSPFVRKDELRKFGIASLVTVMVGGTFSSDSEATLLALLGTAVVGSIVVLATPGTLIHVWRANLERRRAILLIVIAAGLLSIVWIEMACAWTAVNVDPHTTARGWVYGWPAGYFACVSLLFGMRCGTRLLALVGALTILLFSVIAPTVPWGPPKSFEKAIAGIQGVPVEEALARLSGMEVHLQYERVTYPAPHTVSTSYDLVALEDASSEALENTTLSVWGWGQALIDVRDGVVTDVALNFD